MGNTSLPSPSSYKLTIFNHMLVSRAMPHVLHIAQEEVGAPAETSNQDEEGGSRRTKYNTEVPEPVASTSSNLNVPCFASTLVDQNHPTPKSSRRKAEKRTSLSWSSVKTKTRRMQDEHDGKPKASEPVKHYSNKKCPLCQRMSANLRQHDARQKEWVFACLQSQVPGWDGTPQKPGERGHVGCCVPKIFHFCGLITVSGARQKNSTSGSTQ